MNETITAKLRALPRGPGVYMMKDAGERIIYVGKAVNLSSRVRGYFRTGEHDHPRTVAMVKKIVDFDVIGTDNEVESLILEANLIKEYKPRYNVALKDDKRYPYIKITTHEPFPRILVVRRVGKDGARYFGPYTNVKGMRDTIKTLGRIFQIRDCNLAIPSPSGRKYRVCLDYFIKRCPGPCEDKCTESEYRTLIDAACLFLEGREEALVATLQRRMDEASEAMEFEAAAAWRDKLRAVASVQQKQKVTGAERIDRDILATARSGRIVAAVALQVRDGLLIGRQSFQLSADSQDTDETILTAFVQQYYLNSTQIPDEVYLPARLADDELFADWLSKDRSRRVKLLYPQRGERYQLLEMAMTNAKLSLGELLTQKEKADARIPDLVFLLQRELRLKKPPRTIACFDISNLGTTDPVGSQVFFRDGKPLKSKYRKYKIQTVVGQNDYAMMQEAVTRHFSRLIEESEDFPDLVLIDGGIGQLNAAIEALESCNVTDQEIVGLAKRLEEVILPGGDTALSIRKSSPSLQLLRRVRDEAHRFAVTFQRQRRKKRIIQSELDSIPGVGPVRRKALISQFGSVKKIRTASLEEIVATPGVDRKTAQAVYGYYHTQSDSEDGSHSRPPEAGESRRAS